MLNGIWQTADGDQTTFEYEYITKYLFRDKIINKYFDNTRYQTVLDNSIIVYSNNQNSVSSEFIEYLDRFVDLGFKFYLLHLSNENCGHQADYYDKASVVFRCYYDEHLTNSNIIYIPVGFKSGYYNQHFDEIMVYDQKIYDFVFIGQLKSDRYEMNECIKKHKNFTHFTSSWNCKNSLSTDECKSIYRISKFAPCPMGWIHPDSFRIMEALENGCVPILKSYGQGSLDYHIKVWGDNPIPKINTWEEIDNFAGLSDNKYISLYNSVYRWYRDYRKNILNIL